MSLHSIAQGESEKAAILLGNNLKIDANRFKRCGGFFHCLKYTKNYNCLTRVAVCLTGSKWQQSVTAVRSGNWLTCVIFLCGKKKMSTKVILMWLALTSFFSPSFFLPCHILSSKVPKKSPVSFHQETRVTCDFFLRPGEDVELTGITLVFSWHDMSGVAGCLPTSCHFFFS